MANDYEIIQLTFQAAEQPKYTENKSTGMISYGLQNNYPSFLNRLYRESPKHGAIIKSKATYIFGKGLDKLDVLPAINKSGENWNQILKKCIIDDEKYGGYYLQIIWNKMKQIASVSHLKFHKVRTNEDNSKFWVKGEWDVLKQITATDKKKERVYDAFDSSKPFGSQILFVKQQGDENDVYPLPSYFQCLNYLESDILVSRHIMGMAKAGFVPSKSINFNNGEPSKEEKKTIVEGVEKQFTGSEGKRILVTFNKNAENAVTVTDLGVSSLTKEDFTHVNNLIQQEIYAAHQITSPMLFGIKTEGQLGGRSELRDAYEIFKNTYVNERQQAHEEIFNALIYMATGQLSERSIVPVEPIGIEITEAMITALALPKKYFLDKLGINIEDYPELQAEIAPVAPVAPVAQAAVNDNLKNLTAKQHQQIQRTVRDYNKGRITKDAAAVLLKSGYGLTDEEIAMFLIEDTSAQQFLDESLIGQFARHGESKSNFVIVKSVPFIKDNDYVQETFAAQAELTQLETDVLSLVNKDKLVTPETIAEATGAKVEIVKRVLKKFEKAGIIDLLVTGERSLTKPLSELTSIKPTTTSILLRYSYELKDELKAKGEPDIIDTSRPFCVKLIELDKLYSRSDIETISERVGYSVWDRRGGFGCGGWRAHTLLASICLMLSGVTSMLLGMERDDLRLG